MIVFPNCKINLGLHILDKRHDGFHNLETGFYPIPFNDALEIIPGTALEINTSGFVVDGKAEDNLCMRAYQLLKNEFPELSPVRIHLHKAIPMGAGLGGGSADAAYMLKLLNERFQLGLSTEQLINYSLQLGSDAPFFIINKPCFATGRGEILEEIAVDLSKYRIIIINPGIHINTGWAFANRSSGLEHTERLTRSLKEIIQQPIETWKDSLSNDFEVPVFSAYPQIKELKEKLYAEGALYASMSGSGSTVYGIFDNKVDPAPFKHSDYFIKIIN